jgi:hypothetical protein
MMATVQGTRLISEQRREATKIEVATVVRGPISSIDAGSGSLNVMGQSVHASTDTVLDVAGGTLHSLYLGQVVTVSGLFGARGVVEATRISDALAEPPYRVNGGVTSVEPETGTLTINGLVVAADGAELVDLPPSGPQTEQLVVVIGNELVNNVLHATRIALDDRRLPTLPDAEVYVRGPVTRISSDGDFYVDAQRVIRPPEVALPSGGIGFYSIVKVVGTMNAEGVIRAASIELLSGPPTLTLTGQIDAIDVNAGRIELLGTFVYVESWTRIDEGQLFASGGPVLTLSDLSVGEYVQVTVSSSHYAGNVRRVLPLLFHAQISGYFRDISPPDQFTLRGVVDYRVRLVPDTKFFYGHQGYGGPYQYRGCSCVASSADDFWSLANNRKRRGFTYLEVNGHFEGTTLVAVEVFYMEE